ncbi:MAG: hypothetical protein AAB785_02575, partial [Patescibacteria group bacterium]
MKKSLIISLIVIAVSIVVGIIYYFYIYSPKKLQMNQVSTSSNSPKSAEIWTKNKTILFENT